MDTRIVYHGSNQIVEFPEIRTARYNKDFYYGFYCTIFPEQAKRWATRYTGTDFVNEYTYTPDDRLKVLTFPEMSEEWLDFIVDCRLGKPHAYDIVEGPMANDTIFNYVQDFVDGKISRAAFWELAKFKKPTHLFYTCSLIEFIGRKCHRKRSDIVNILGEKVIERIYRNADILHCEVIDAVADRYIELMSIADGNYDNVSLCKYTIPDYWTIGAVYERLIEDVSEEISANAIITVYNSWISNAISNYNTDFYYQPRDYIKECYLAGRIL